jgi:hypothetical protein
MDMKLYCPNLRAFKIKCHPKDKLIQNKCQNNPIWKVVHETVSP